MVAATKMLVLFFVTSLVILTTEGFHLQEKEEFPIRDKRVLAVEVTTKPLPTGTVYVTHTAPEIAMIVLTDGCYEYIPSKHEYHDLRNHHTRPDAEKLLFQKLAMAINFHEIDHHTIDHYSNEMRTACADLPVYRFDLPTPP